MEPIRIPDVAEFESKDINQETHAHSSSEKTCRPRRCVRAEHGFLVKSGTI